MPDKINELINDIVTEKSKDLLEELELTKQQLNKTKDECIKLKMKNGELESTINKTKLVTEIEMLFVENNFETMIPLFNLKHNDFLIGGMYSDKIPNWFKWVFHYYEDRDKLFNLMDVFGVGYPTWAKNYKMPYEYTEEELKIFINPGHDRYICNGETFSGNIGFFWTNVEKCRGNTHEMLVNKQAFTDYIPWQLVLSNPKWANNEMFNEIIKSIKNGNKDSYNFFAIQEYISLSDAQIIEMIKLLPTNNLYSVHKKFIKNNIELIKGNEIFTKLFKDKMNEDTHSIFSYLNYTLDAQKEFIRSLESAEIQLKLINKMEVPKEEKIRFCIEFIK